MESQNNYLNEQNTDEAQDVAIVRRQYKKPSLEEHGDFDTLTQGWTSGKYSDPYPGGAGSVWIKAGK